MFKFKIKINKEFKFKTTINNVHNFAIKALNALIVKEIEVLNEYSSKAEIGGRKVELKEWSGDLRSLPSSLRQFVGAYVHIKAKMRLNNISNYSNKLTTKILSKLKMQSLYTSVIEIGASMKAKMKAQNKYSSSLNIKAIIHQKLRAIVTYGNHTSLKYDVKLKTKISLLYKSTTLATKTYFIRGKMKFVSMYSSSCKIVVMLITKIRFNENRYTNEAKFKDKVRAKIKPNQSYRSRTNLGGHLPLVFYDNTSLKNLQTSLKEFVGSVSRVLAKMRLSNNASLSDNLIIGRILAKLKISNHDTLNESLSSNCYECKRLLDYSQVDLNDVDTKLFDFCYGISVNSWGNIIRRNDSWEEVKTKHSSWGAIKDDTAYINKNKKVI